MNRGKTAVLLLLLALLSSAACTLFESEPRICDICRRPIRPASHYRIHLRDGHIEEACCTSCGLHFEDGRQDVIKREVADFETGEMMKAEEAFYVENSSVHLCCANLGEARDRSGSSYSLTWDRCLPSLLAFRSHDDAARFQKEKGGAIRTFGELVAERSR